MEDLKPKTYYYDEVYDEYIKIKDILEDFVTEIVVSIIPAYISHHKRSLDSLKRLTPSSKEVFEDAYIQASATLSELVYE